jgi:outer membrane protein TolC
MRVLSFTLGLVLVAQSAFCLGLEDMQEIALSKREIIKRAVVNLEKSEKDIGIARSGFLPSVDLTYQGNLRDESSSLSSSGSSLSATSGGGISLNTDRDSTFVGSVSWNVFNGFKDKYQLESSQLLNEVEGHQLQGLKQDIQLNVALRFLAVYERRASLEVAKKNFETLQKIYRDAQNRFDVGLIDKNELLKFKVDLDNSDLLTEQAKANLQKSVNLLGREIGEELELGQLDFSLFETVPTKQDVEKDRATMLDQRSELQALTKLKDASVLQAKTVESEYYPKVDLIGSYSNFDNDLVNGSGEVNSDELRAQLSLSFNLYRGGSTGESVAKARLETRGLQYDLKEQTDSLLAELQNLHIDLDISIRNLEVALLGIEQAEENLRVTRLKYSEGLQRESELLDAVANLSRAEFNYVAVVRTIFENHFNITRTIEAF